VGASFCKRLTSQAENVPRSIDIPVMNRSAILASPVSYFETLEAFPVPLADRDARGGLAGSPGTMERYRTQEWLNFITSELHKSFAPLFRSTTPDAYKDIARGNLSKRYDWIDEELARKPYVTGDKFTVAAAYLFTVTRWAPWVGIETAKWRNVTAFMDRVGARPKVQEALKAEGLA
jgi:glutathione S-transferase